MTSTTLQISIRANYDFLEGGTPNELGNRISQRVHDLVARSGLLNDPISVCDEHETSVSINANQYSDLITQYVRESLLSGDMRPERIAGMITAYGLMSPAEFIEAIEDKFGAFQNHDF